MLHATITQNPAGLLNEFQWAPTLGGECYPRRMHYWLRNGRFQWAPTLGGECYFYILWDRIVPEDKVSMGTHPWG